MSDHPKLNEPDGFVERQMHRVSRNLLLWNGLVLVLLAIIAFLLRTYLGCFLQGPQRVDDADILDAAQGPRNSLIAYVEIRDHPLIPTGYVEESLRNGEVYATMQYDLIKVGDKQMLVKTTQHEHGHKLVGPLQFISAKADQQALDAIVAKNPSLGNEILPVMLDAAAAFTVLGYVSLGVFTPILVLCLYNIARAITRHGKTSGHPVKTLACSTGRSFQGGPSHRRRDGLACDPQSGESVHHSRLVAASLSVPAHCVPNRRHCLGVPCGH